MDLSKELRRIARLLDERVSAKRKTVKEKRKELEVVNYAAIEKFLDGLFKKGQVKKRGDDFGLSLEWNLGFSDEDIKEAYNVWIKYVEEIFDELEKRGYDIDYGLWNKQTNRMQQSMTITHKDLQTIHLNTGRFRPSEFTIMFGMSRTEYPD